MTGKEIFEKINKEWDRAQDGPDSDYASLILTLHNHSIANQNEDQFFSLLEKAEKENKKLHFPHDDLVYSEDEYHIDEVVLI
ncbi:MAG: hypothetical protein SH818_14780 [Saprospiraceae bacterium]|nr:hypothetical protein [Saprospiraceae bacterium]